MQTTLIHRLAKRLAGWVLPVALILFWQLAVSAGWLSSRVLPSPGAVLQAGWKLVESGEIWTHLGISSWRALVGFVIGGGIGLALGLATGLSDWAERLLDSSIQMIRNVPHLALIPLVILWFGIDETAKIFLVALGTFFPIYLNTYHGIRNVDPGLVEMARSYGLSGFALFRQVLLPGALASILVGVRFALGLMWLTLIVAETISASSGIGYLAMNAREFLQTDVVVLAIVLYALLGKLADSAARLLERVWLRWNPAYQRTGGRLMTAAEKLPGGASLDVRGLSKSFGQRRVLEGIDLEIPPGQFVAVVGRSGCGKSTLLRLLAGLDTASKGQVLADGRPLAELREATRLMFQEARLLPWKKVLDNVTLGLPRTWRDQAREALVAVGLAERADEWPAALSGGQKQRVALARALVHQPRLLLLDEPLGALDALTRIEMQRLIEGLWRQHGFTVLLVTHDVSEAVALADRVLLIEEGRLGLDLSVDLARPRSRSSAGLADLESQVLNRVLAVT